MNDQWRKDLNRVRKALDDPDEYRRLYPELFDYLRASIRRQATSKTMRREDARLQLLALCEKDLRRILEAFDGNALLTTFLETCVKNRVRKVYRKILSEDSGELSMTPYELAKMSARMQRRAEMFREWQRFFDRHKHNLEKLDLRERNVFTYFYRERRSFNEIARKLNISNGLARKLKSRAKKKLESLSVQEA